MLNIMVFIKAYGDLHNQIRIQVDSNKDFKVFPLVPINLKKTQFELSYS